MFARCILGLAVLAAGFADAVPVQAATVFETTEVLADSANQSLLTEPKTFTITAAGTYQLQLEDLQHPLQLGSLKAIVTRDLKVVAQADVVYPAGGAAPTPVAVSFDATPGSYRVHVVGTVAAGNPAGLFSMKVTAADSTAVVSQAGSISPPQTAASGESVLQAKFDIAQAGDYDLVLADQAFPVALASTNMLLLESSSSTPIVVSPTGRFTAAAGSYELFVIANADATVKAGLYSISVTNVAAGTLTYASTQPVGQLSPAALLAIPAAGQYQLTLDDAKFPAELSSLSAVVVQQNAIAQQLSAAGTATLNLVQGDLQIYVQATPVTATEIGVYKLRLVQGAQVVVARTQFVDASPAPGTPSIYSFSSRSAVAAGARRLTIKDFSFPQALSTFKAVVVQGDTVSALRDGSGTLDVTLRAEPVSVLVAATAPTNGLFGMTLATQAVGAADLESTQGVGSLFKSQVVQVTTAGRYDLTLADLQFPAALRSSALAVTRGTTLVGQVFGSGVITGQQLDPGTYVLNFVGQPATTSHFGSYGLKVADAPAAPVITFTASPASVRSGQQSTLQWSTTNATSCSASGGWSGTRATSGSLQTDTLQATTSFELSCSGPGGSSTSSATVTVSTARSKGGGGATDLLLLLGLIGLIGARRTATFVVP